MKRALTLLALLAIGGCRDQMLPPETNMPINSATNARIVYTRPGTGIQGESFGSVRADGSDNVPGGNGSLATPPAGSLVAFILPGLDGAYATACVANIDGSGRRTVYTATTVEEQIMSVIGLSPTGDRIAFQTQDGLIRVIKLDDGTSATFSPGGMVYGPPVFSPDGRSIAYCLRPDGVTNHIGNIMVTELDGALTSSTLSTTALCVVDRSSIAWSQDGHNLAYSDVRSATATGYVSAYEAMPAAGGGGHALSGNGVYYRGIAWSPDGTELAYAGGPDEKHSDIWIVSADGSSRSCITPDSPEIESAPQWSPDGGKLLYLKSLDPAVSEAPGGHVVIYDRAAGEATSLDALGLMMNAYWSVDLF